MQNLFAVAVAIVASLVTGAALAQSGPMTGGGMGGYGGWMSGYGGYWLPVLLAGVVGLVVWLVIQKRK